MAPFTSNGKILEGISQWVALLMAKPRRDFSRRKFLKTIGSAAVAGAFPGPLQFATPESSQTERVVRARAVVFWDADFPEINGCGVTRELLRRALEDFEVIQLSEPELIDRLKKESFDLLITPYGSAFPKRAWRAMLQYLLKGGNWLNLGGVPLAVPVLRTKDQWQPETPQTAYHKRLGITQTFPIEASSITSYETAHVAEGEIGKAIKPREIYEFYVRFTSTSYFNDEVGSDGPREAVLQPLVFCVNQQQRRIAAPIIQIDRLQGDFAGGRWVFANFSGRISANVIRVLARQAIEGAIQFLVRSDFACYRETESPSFSVQIHRPKNDLDKIIRGECRIEIHNSANQTISQQSISINREQATGVASLGERTKLVPGFYKVHARQSFNSTTNGSVYELSYITGFWVYDNALMTSGKALTVDNHFFYRDGKVLPITGTTYMASDVHRQFLWDPNPLVWDQDFRAMKAAGVNMVRTGIWTGWKKYMSPDGKVNEVALRALDAFLLTARKHDIPVIFTFFAFLPETWGGKNAYLDPQAVQAQQRFISTFAQRYREVDDLIWDFINEPSFCSSKHLWSCRPNYDEYEKAAWQAWLKERYAAENEEARAAKLQELWRSTGDDPLDLPRLEDFEDRHIFDARYPLKTLDYRLFAQDMFARWARAMTTAIRSNGNPKQLITVGQDEAGLRDSPNSQFLGETIDFASLHNWWNNDDLVWDNVVSKPPGKANLVEETGVMFYEKTDGTAWRTEEKARNLLERKMAISLGADGAGFIQWIWNANCYINSDNEAAIGFHRVDQTAKPELEPFLDIAKFYSTHSHLLHGVQQPQVLMVIPHSQMFSPRNFATEATRRCVRAMYYHCRTPLHAVSEYALTETSAKAKLIVVPSPRALTQHCWEALINRAMHGATVVISGILDSDDHWLPVERSERFGWITGTAPVSESEFLMIAGRQYHVRYEGEKIQRVEKAVIKSAIPVQVLSRPIGAGRIIWSPLPLELGESIEPVAAFYRLGLRQAGVLPRFRVVPDTPVLLILPSVFENVVLYTLVSEVDRDMPVTLVHQQTRTRFALTIPAERTALLLIDRKSGRLIASSGSLGTAPII